MNDGKIIIDKIMGLADKEIKKLETKTNNEIDEIVRIAQEKENKERERIDFLIVDEKEKARAKEVSGAELDGKIRVLNEKQSILKEVIQAAQEKLENLPDSEYEKVIGTMLDKLDTNVGKEVIFSAKDSTRVASVVKEKGFTLLDETRDIDGGFIVKNNEVEYNYTFASIMAIEEEEIKQIIAEIVF